MKSWFSLLVFSVLCSTISAQTVTNQPLVVVRNGLYGYIDHRGNVVIEPQFLWASEFGSHYGTVFVCGRYAFIDVDGKLSSDNHFESGKKLFSRRIGSKFGFTDAKGKLRIAPQFDDVRPFSEGLAAVRVGNQWGFIDDSGKPVVSPQFEEAFYFREGLGTVQINGETVLVDRTGKIIVRGFELLSGVAAEGRIPVSRGDKYGYLDLTGTIVIPLTFDGASTFSEGLAAVKKDSKWGYIDRTGTVVIPFKYDFAQEFGNGLAPVKSGTESGFITRAGRFAFHLAFEQAPGFSQLDSVSDVSPFFTKNAEFGYVDTNGNVIWGPTRESPDHPPLFGWSEESKKQSCDVVSNALRKAANALPADDGQ